MSHDNEELGDVRVRLSFTNERAWDQALTYLVREFPSANIDVIVGSDIILDNSTYLKAKAHREFRYMEDERLYTRSEIAQSSARQFDEEYRRRWAERGKLRTPHGTDLNVLDKLIRSRVEAVTKLYPR